MTASTLLTDLCRRSVLLRLSADRLRILIPKDALTPELREALVAVKPQMMGLIELADQYRRLLRDAFAAGPASRKDGAARRRQFADEQARLLDDLGPSLATAVAEMEVRAWRADTGSCPTCEGSGQCAACASEPES